MAEYDRLVRYEQGSYERPTTRGGRRVMPSSSELHRFMALGVASSSGMLQPSVSDIQSAELARERAYAHQSASSPTPSLQPSILKTLYSRFRSEVQRFVGHNPPSQSEDIQAKPSKKQRHQEVVRGESKGNTTPPPRLSRDTLPTQGHHDVIELNSESDQESQEVRVGSHDPVTIVNDVSSEAEDDTLIEVLAHRRSSRPVFDLTDDASDSDDAEHQRHSAEDGGGQPNKKRKRKSESEEAIRLRLERNRQKLEALRSQLAHRHDHPH